MDAKIACIYTNIGNLMKPFNVLKFVVCYNPDQN